MLYYKYKTTKTTHRLYIYIYISIKSYNILKKEDNHIYMQLGFSKQVSENLIEDFLSTIVSNIKADKKLKLSKF